MAASDDGLVLGQIMARFSGVESRLDRMDGRLLRIEDGLADLRIWQGTTDERLRQGVETFRAQGMRLDVVEAETDAIRERAERDGHYRSESQRQADRRWRRLAMIGGMLGVAATWLALLGQAMGWW